jgi:hypothetical protein
MAMRKSTCNELRKLRELVRFTLRGKCCFFCHKELFEDDATYKDGDGRGAPIACQITVHHVDLNHDNDRRENKRLAHSSCHKRFHMKLDQPWLHRGRRVQFDSRRGFTLGRKAA